MNTPTFVQNFSDNFIKKNIRNFVDIHWHDPGLVRVQNILVKWLHAGTRNINQHTFNNIEVNSNFNKDELISLATYMWSVFNTTVQGMPSNQYAIERCWISNAGALQPSGRHRISFQGAYYLNYDFNARVMFGQAVHEWSHLCNNPQCERPSHLCDEDHKTNMTRTTCPGIMYCPNTNNIWVMCTHVPLCKHVHLSVAGPMTFE